MSSEKYNSLLISDTYGHTHFDIYTLALYKFKHLYIYIYTYLSMYTRTIPIYRIYAKHLCLCISKKGNKKN